jgi:hypothetical protein
VTQFPPGQLFVQPLDLLLVEIGELGLSRGAGGGRA